MDPTTDSNTDQTQNIPVPPPSNQPDITPQPLSNPLQQQVPFQPLPTPATAPQPVVSPPVTTPASYQPLANNSQNVNIPPVPPQIQASSVPSNPSAFAAPTSQPPQDNVVPNVPTDWPHDATGEGLYKYSKQAVKLNLGALLVLFVLNAVVSIAGNQISKSLKLGLGVGAISLLLGIWLNAANVSALIDSVDGKKVSLGHAFGRASSVFLKVFVATILSYIAIIIGFLLLIIPGFIVLARLSLIHYYIVDQKLGPIAGIKASLAATKGNIRKIFQIWSLNILICLLALTIIGIPFALYFWFMFSAATAVAYRYLGGAIPKESLQSVPVSSSNQNPTASTPTQLPPYPTV